ncbi:probable carotenoid cleavage dioxygenase 4, chloroplastic [Salvia miltiorrhiza]|uniref:probable carotenoid cleavage dioxygenase 4, chloroplastic n=1 Tax=Salvia miltiorrhiza TaxID=226208 RepID=UPI0025ABD47C|nr:probable carotenoid cleavage dioxygenase 4, chloroplastic [Salvia miltiorrhiza]
MATLILYSSFIPRNDEIRNRMNSTKFHHHRHPIIITAKSSSTIFHHLTKKLPIYQIPQLPLTSIFKSLDDFICNVVDLPLPPFLDPKHVLSGNFAPVGELPPTTCNAVEGSLPSCLDGGAYIRNGPNPQFIPKGPYHVFEGDGMLHMIKFSHGKPTFCCRYVNTHKYAVEREIGYAFVPSIFSSFNGGLLASISRFLLTSARILAGQFDPINHGLGPANTSLALISGRLYALCESDLPYAVDITADGDIKTLGRHDFGASTPFSRMTAHPKIDRVTGEVFAFEYVGTPPSLKLFRIDSSGRRRKHVAISMEKFTAIHDFAVTEKYAVIPDVQIVVNPWSILRGRSPVEIDLEKVARVGIIRRYAEDEKEMVWIDAPGFNPLHCANAWEEDGGDTVCMVASNALAVDQLLDNVDCAQLKMEKIVINVKAKTVQRQTLSPEILDFGVINPAYATNKNRYVYAGIVGELRLTGVVKLDLSLLNNEVGGDCTVASRRYGPGSHGSETFFVAREPNNPAAEEDDGYLVAYLHDDNTQESKFIVMDAKSPNLDIIAAVKLPQRIPTGFHGLFLPETDLTKLRRQK